MNKLEDIIRYEQFDNLEFIASQIVAGFITGLYRSPYHGFSVEFAEHRVYNTGESTKHVDWKLYARTEKLFVKQFEEETNLRSYLVLDTSSSMLFSYPSAKVSKLRFSVYCTAALIHLLRKQRDASGLCLFSDRIEVLTDAKSNSTHIQTMYAHLQEILQNHSVSLNNPHRQPRCSTNWRIPYKKERWSLFSPICFRTEIRKNSFQLSNTSAIINTR